MLVLSPSGWELNFYHLFLQSNWSKKNSGVSVLDMLSLNNIFFANNSLAAGSFELYFKEFFADWFANDNSGASTIQFAQKQIVTDRRLDGTRLNQRRIFVAPGCDLPPIYIYFRICLPPILHLFSDLHLSLALPYTLHTPAPHQPHGDHWQVNNVE